MKGQSALCTTGPATICESGNSYGVTTDRSWSESAHMEWATPTLTALTQKRILFMDATDAAPLLGEDLYRQANRHTITTITRDDFDVFAPVIDIEDIAHGLSNLCRYNGQSKTFYNVADHSIMVCKLMGGSLEGLLHDATEAYMSDVSAPIKQLLPDWSRIDQALEQAVRAHWHLPAQKTQSCEKADRVALFIEAEQIIRNKGRHFIDPHAHRETARYHIAFSPEHYRITGPSDPEKSKQKFLDYYHQLKGDHYARGSMDL